jgi:hypothetical protein
MRRRDKIRHRTAVQTNFIPRKVAFRSATDLDAPENEVRCALVNGHGQPKRSGPKSARIGLGGLAKAGPLPLHKLTDFLALLAAAA